MVMGLGLAVARIAPQKRGRPIAQLRHCLRRRKPCLNGFGWLWALISFPKRSVEIHHRDTLSSLSKVLPFPFRSIFLDSEDASLPQKKKTHTSTICIQLAQFPDGKDGGGTAW